MKKLLGLLSIVLLGLLLVGCKQNIVPPRDDEDIPLVPLEPSTPKEDKEDKEVINTIIFKEVVSEDNIKLPTSASKIVFGETYELDFNGIKGRADGFALASGQGTGLKNEFILKAYKQDISFLELNLEEEVEVELDLHMWFTTTTTQWLGELRLNDEVVVKGMEALKKEVKTFKLNLNKGVNRFEYESVGGSYATQLVFKEMRVIK